MEYEEYFSESVTADDAFEATVLCAESLLEELVLDDLLAQVTESFESVSEGVESYDAIEDRLLSQLEIIEPTVTLVGAISTSSLSSKIITLSGSTIVGVTASDSSSVVATINTPTLVGVRSFTNLYRDPKGVYILVAEQIGPNGARYLSKPIRVYRTV
jgi:hypothetical protein